MHPADGNARESIVLSQHCPCRLLGPTELGARPQGLTRHCLCCLQEAPSWRRRGGREGGSEAGGRAKKRMGCKGAGPQNASRTAWERGRGHHHTALMLSSFCSPCGCGQSHLRGGMGRRTTSNTVAMGVGVGVRCVCRCDRPYMDSTHTQVCSLPGRPTDGFLISSSHQRITKNFKDQSKGCTRSHTLTYTPGTDNRTTTTTTQLKTTPPYTRLPIH